MGFLSKLWENWGTSKNTLPPKKEVKKKINKKVKKSAKKK
tara:strand:+ start:142 stop:261 length:120 start_codon:yes stop_codon:yes gene_type:complete